MPSFLTKIMPFRPVFLWTDILLLLLLAAIVFIGVYASGQEHLLAPLRQVRRRALAMAALTVLLSYVGIGFLDSLHFRQRLPQTEAGQEIQYSPEVLSLLDLVVGQLRKNVERTYSAPLATQSFAKEMLEFPGGVKKRVYPPLAHGGAHLKDPNNRGTDIMKTLFLGVLRGLVLTSILCLTFLHLLSRHHRCSWKEAYHAFWNGQYETAWLAILITLSLIIVLAAIVIPLSGQYHLFGTDKVGQDVLYLALKGIRTGLVIGGLTTLVMLPFALFFGIAAGYFRGWVDDVIQYLYTTLSSVPGVLLIAAAVLILQVYMDKHADSFSSITERADIRLLFLCLILGMTSWIGLCRLLRGETLKLRESEYVQAAIALGVSRFRILIRHILPNVMHIVLISVVLDFSGLVLAEAVLSYVGVGVDPAMISWGNMINSARMEMAREPIVWWSLSAAFIFMFGLVLTANIFSDAVRDAFDPRLRSR
ncbi:MAG: ABC transporter permease [Nitrospiria bacterium]